MKKLALLATLLAVLALTAANHKQLRLNVGERAGNGQVLLSLDLPKAVSIRDGDYPATLFFKEGAKPLASAPITIAVRARHLRLPVQAPSPTAAYRFDFSLLNDSGAEVRFFADVQASSSKSVDSSVFSKPTPTPRDSTTPPAPSGGAQPGPQDRATANDPAPTTSVATDPAPRPSSDTPDGQTSSGAERPELVWLRRHGATIGVGVMILALLGTFIYVAVRAWRAMQRRRDRLTECEERLSAVEAYQDQFRQNSETQRQKIDELGRSISGQGNQLPQQSASAGSFASSSTNKRIEELTKQVDDIRLTLEMPKMAARTRRRNGDVAPKAKTGASVAGLESGEAQLLAAVNHWIHERSLPRSELLNLCRTLGVSATLYRFQPPNPTQSDTILRFTESNSDGGWLWLPLPDESRALVLPTEPSFAHTDAARDALARMFRGVDGAPRTFEYYQIWRAACLERMEPGGYRISRRGDIQMKNTPAPALSPPPTYESLCRVQAASRQTKASVASFDLDDALAKMSDALDRVIAELATLRNTPAPPVCTLQQLEVINGRVDELRRDLSILTTQKSAAVKLKSDVAAPRVQAAAAGTASTAEVQDIARPVESSVGTSVAVAPPTWQAVLAPPDEAVTEEPLTQRVVRFHGKAGLKAVTLTLVDDAYEISTPIDDPRPNNALRLGSHGAPDLEILYPPGRVDPSCDTVACTLIQDPPDTPFVIHRVLQPARLRKAVNSQYQLVGKLQWT